MFRREARLALWTVAIMVLLQTTRAWGQDGVDKRPMDQPAPNARPASSGPSASSAAVTKPVHDTTTEDSSRPGFVGHIADFVEDQKQIWTSPARVRPADATWLIPLGGITAGLFVTDRQYSASLSRNPTTISHYKTVSNLGVASLVGAGAGLYLFSFPTHKDHWRETGFLAGEAALNSLVTIEALKYSAGRERPYQGNGSGSFFQGGTSFPSEHAAAAWSIAGVIAHEYPGTLPKLFAYGAASAVSFSRVHARQHFPSDVVIGSVLGYLVAESVYRRRHDPEIGGGAWEAPREFVESDKSHSPAFMGSPYVPLDSWIYAAMERLAALGYVRTAVLGIRPWTRLECARLVGEAAELQPDVDGPREVQELYHSLAREFQREKEASDGENSNVHAQIESVYARSLGVSGKPLTDNEHFGQTILNDYGRPYQEGFNSVVGTSGWTTAGPFVIYARGEYQSAPSAPSLSTEALNFIAYEDSLPSNPPAMPIAGVSRFRLLDAYVGMNLANWQISFGKQSLWWGPGEEGAMLFTNNAEPLNKMFRINRVSPFRLPWFFAYLGDIRMEFFIGRVSGQQFINNSVPTASSGIVGQYGRSLQLQPFLSGEKISFKFTPNFEISMSKTTLYGGPGNVLTPHTFIKSTLSFQGNNSPIGDGRAALDFSYRIPKLRNWLNLYGDAFQEDEISPLNRPYKSAFQAGLYLVRFPRIPKLDFRLEGGTTSPLNFPQCYACYYGNSQYLNGYTNNGELIGTWVGRAAQGEAIRSNYWLGPQRKISFELRHRKMDRMYLPEGGTQNDIAVSGDFFLKSGFRFSGTLQYENWQIPLLAMTRQSNIAVSFQVGYWPKVHGR